MNSNTRIRQLHPDLRHADLAIEQLGLEHAKPFATLGVDVSSSGKCAGVRVERGAGNTVQLPYSIAVGVVTRTQPARGMDCYRYGPEANLTGQKQAAYVFGNASLGTLLGIVW